MLTKEEIAEKLSTQQSRLRYFRELNNVTIDKICLNTGINRSTYNLLERDPIKNHNIGHYMLLAEYYGTSLDYIIGNDVEPTHMLNYMTKRMLDEMQNKRNAFRYLGDSLTINDELPLEKVNTQLIECLRMSDSTFRRLKSSVTSIPSHIIEKHICKVYPYNLLATIIGTEALCVDFSITNNLMDDIDRLLDEYLNERDAYIIRLRYVNELTLEQIASVTNVTRERVRQLEAKAIRQLRHIVYTQKLLQSAQIRENRSKIEEQQQVIKELERQIDYLKGELTQEMPLLHQDIHKLSLSNRAYNALKFAGIHTVEDIMHVIASHKLFKIQSLGKNSINNIFQQLVHYRYLESIDEGTEVNQSKSSFDILKQIKDEIKDKYNIT